MPTSHKFIKILVASTFLVLVFLGTIFLIFSAIGQKHQTPDEYLETKTLLLKIVQNQDPHVALQKLDELMQSSPTVFRSCHALVHEIGHAAVEKYGTFTAAMKFQNDLCGSGYMHGVIEKIFSLSKDIGKEMFTICEPNNDQSCFHGVGHGLMYTSDNNVTKSIAACDLFTDRVAKVGCAEGVFMENFNTDSDEHFSEFLDPKNPFFPCDRQQSFYQDVCYFYAPEYYLNLHLDAFSDALKLCTTAPTDFVRPCVKGVASRAMKRNINNISAVEQLCDEIPILTNSCIDGMVSYYIVNFSSVTKGLELCEELQGVHQKYCLDSVEIRKDWR